MKKDRSHTRIAQDNEGKIIKAAVDRVYAKFGTDLKLFRESANKTEVINNDGDKTKSQF